MKLKVFNQQVVLPPREPEVFLKLTEMGANHSEITLVDKWGKIVPNGHILSFQLGTKGKLVFSRTRYVNFEFVEASDLFGPIKEV